MLTGFVIGVEITRARAIRLGVDVRDIVDGSVVTVAMGLVIGHVVHVVARNPSNWRPMNRRFACLAGFSSTGGFIGAVIGSVLFFRWIRKREY